MVTEKTLNEKSGNNNHCNDNYNDYSDTITHSPDCQGLVPNGIQIVVDGAGLDQRSLMLPELPVHARFTHGKQHVRVGEIVHRVNAHEVGDAARNVEI